MNRLQLAQRLRAECDAGGTGPTTTIGQTGEYLNLVNWIDEAWTLIQQQFKWGFLWEQATIPVTIGTNLDATASVIPAQRYVQESGKIGSSPVQYLPWSVFSLTYPDSLVTSGDTPMAWTIRPDKRLAISSKPTAAFSLTVERYKNPVVMTDDDDVPALEAEHHMMIVWRAMMMYAQHEEAGSVYRTGKASYEEKLELLGLVDLPDVSFGQPLLSY